MSLSKGFGQTSTASRSPVSVTSPRGRGRTRKEKEKTKMERAKDHPQRLKVLVQRPGRVFIVMKEVILLLIAPRRKEEKKGEKGEKGSKGGKPKGKRATEFSSYQPESEAGSEVWSEPDVEDGGRLSVCLSPSMHAEPFFFCQSLDAHDPYLWLVDSGASRTVVSEQALQVYKVLRVRHLEKPIKFRTASGEQVEIDRQCMLEVFFHTFIEFDDHDKSKLIRYEVRSVIGPVEQNLLSVDSLTRMGATFQFGPDSCSIRVSDIRRMDCNVWANVPWIRAHRRKGRGSSGSSSGDVDMEHSLTQDTWSDSSPSPVSPETPFRLSDRSHIRIESCENVEVFR